MKEAMYYEKLEGGAVRCNLCAHCCFIKPGKVGICGVRLNQDGVLYTLVYGKSISENVDPIEKKPLFHFYPGSSSFSIATVGCNFHCDHCQNFEISQMPRDEKRIIGRDLLPPRVVEMAKETGCLSISYTYTEPTIFYEYAYDTAKIAQKEGIKNIFVTNGYITEEALKGIAPFLDAANVDLKSFSNEHYKKICGASLQPVLGSLKLYKKLGIWLEVTTLVVPGFNDSEGELKEIATFIKNELGEGTPWHVSRFYPAYKMLDVSPTPVETLRKAREIGLEVGLRYVYMGNVPPEGENTFCYNCGELLIERIGYTISFHKVSEGRCYNCGVLIDGVGLG